MDELRKRLEDGPIPQTTDRERAEAALKEHLRMLGAPERPVEWKESPEDAHCTVTAFAVEALMRDRREGTRLASDCWDFRASAAENRLGAAMIRQPDFDLNDRHHWRPPLSGILGLDLGRVERERPAIDPNETLLGRAAYHAWLLHHLPPMIAYHVARAGAAQDPLWRLIIDAYDAGLFAFWPMNRAVVCVGLPPHAIRTDEVGRLHGAAAVWLDGYAMCYWHGVRVPAWMIQRQELITPDAIRQETNQEIRRCMVEIKGIPWFLREGGARLLHEDETGRLWEIEGLGRAMWRFVEVENGTPEPDGTRRIYVLDVTGAAATLGWPIETARAAVAATYALRPEEYRPDVRT